MSKYIISAETTTDLTEEKLKQLDVLYINYKYMIDDKEYIDDFGKTITYKQFYNAMRQGALTKTSLVSKERFIEYFKPILKEGKNIVHLTLSSGLSKTYEQCVEAAKELQKEYPNNKVHVIDSLGASSGFGLLVDKASELKAEGKTFEEIIDWLEKYKYSVHYWFYSTDLTYYVRGGRLSAVSGFFGNLLNVFPILNMDREGKLIPKFKTIGKKRAQAKLLQLIKEQALGKQVYNEKCFISHSDCLDEALSLAKKIENNFPKLRGNVEIYNIGTTVGSHAGPGTIAVFFWGDARN